MELLCALCILNDQSDDTRALTTFMETALCRECLVSLVRNTPGIYQTPILRHLRASRGPMTRQGDKRLGPKK